MDYPFFSILSLVHGKGKKDAHSFPTLQPREQMATENVVSFLLSRPTVSVYSRTWDPNRSTPLSMLGKNRMLLTFQPY